MAIGGIQNFQFEGMRVAAVNLDTYGGAAAALASGQVSKAEVNTAQEWERKRDAERAALFAAQTAAQRAADAANASSGAATSTGVKSIALPTDAARGAASTNATSGAANTPDPIGAAVSAVTQTASGFGLNQDTLIIIGVLISIIVAVKGGK